MHRNALRKKIDISLISIIFSFVLIAIMTLALVSFSIYENMKTFENFSKEIKLNQKKIEFASNMKVAGYQRGYVQNMMVITEDPFKRDELFLEYNKYGYNGGFSRSELKKLIKSKEEQEIYNLQTPLIEQVLLLQEEVNIALENEKFELAAQLRRQAYEDGRFQEVFASLNKMIEIQKENEKNLLLQAESRFSKNIQKAAIILVSIIIFIFLIATYVVIRIKREKIQIENFIIELEQNRSDLYRLSHHDFLTGLPNRCYFYEVAKEWIVELEKNSLNSLFILFFDLDKFKTVNDNLGHQSGDQLLKEVANRLKTELSEDKFIARVGGDEFAILLKDTKNGCQTLAEKIISLLKIPFTISDTSVNIGSSIGISQFIEDGHDIDTLVRKADISMYYAKQTGGNNYHFSTNNDLINRVPKHEQLISRNQAR